MSDFFEFIWRHLTFQEGIPIGIFFWILLGIVIAGAIWLIQSLLGEWTRKEVMATSKVLSHEMKWRRPQSGSDTFEAGCDVFVVHFELDKKPKEMHFYSDFENQKKKYCIGRALKVQYVKEWFGRGRIDLIRSISLE